MRGAFLEQVLETLRETFEGGRPGEGTQYLDHASGILPTLRSVDAERASRSIGGRPTIAAHARHMNFHLRATVAWINGDRKQQDWPGSFEPQSVTADEWRVLQEDLQRSRLELERVLRALDADTFLREGAGIGPVAHLAYHLGAIRQLVHLV